MAEADGQDRWKPDCFIVDGKEDHDLIYNRGKGEVRGEKDLPRNQKTGGGLYSEEVATVDDCKALLNQCICNRRWAFMPLNPVSSRRSPPHPCIPTSVHLCINASLHPCIHASLHPWLHIHLHPWLHIHASCLTVA